jgi:hypothetical protein
MHFQIGGERERTRVIKKPHQFTPDHHCGLELERLNSSMYVNKIKALKTTCDYYVKRPCLIALAL